MNIEKHQPPSGLRMPSTCVAVGGVDEQQQQQRQKEAGRRSWEQSELGGSHRKTNVHTHTHTRETFAAGATSAAAAAAHPCIGFHLSRIHSIISRTMPAARGRAISTPFLLQPSRMKMADYILAQREVVAAESESVINFCVSLGCANPRVALSHIQYT